MSQQIEVLIKGNQGAGKSQIGQAMLTALDKLNKSAVLKDSGTMEFNKRGIQKKNRGELMEVEIKTDQTSK